MQRPHNWKKWFIDLKNFFPEPLQHMPFMQTLIGIGYYFEFEFITEDIVAIDKKFQEMTHLIVQEFKTANGIDLDTLEIKQNDKIEKINETHLPTEAELLEKIQTLAEKRYLAKKYQEVIMGAFYECKMMETFLENAPQSILQLTIVMQTGIITKMQYFNIFTSFLSFTMTAGEIYLNHPTLVLKTIDLIYIEQLFQHHFYF